MGDDDWEDVRHPSSNPTRSFFDFVTAQPEFFERTDHTHVTPQGGVIGAVTAPAQQAQHRLQRFFFRSSNKPESPATASPQPPSKDGHDDGTAGVSGRRILSALIGRGIDLSSRDAQGNTPLLWALREYVAAVAAGGRQGSGGSSRDLSSPSSGRFVSMSAALAPSATKPASSEARTANLRAMALALLEDDTMALAKNNEDACALHVIASLSSVEAASPFLAALSGVNGQMLSLIPDGKGRTPLLLAVFNGNVDVALALISRFGVNPVRDEPPSTPSPHVDKNGQNLLHALASHSWEGCNYRSVKDLIDVVAADERTQRLATDSFGRTPLFVAHRRVKSPVILAEIASLYPASDAVHANGTPALFDAVRNDCHVSVKHLQGFKTGVRYIRDGKNRSALFFARSLSMIKLLHDAGLHDLRIVDSSNGRTAIHAMSAAAGEFGDEDVAEVVSFLHQADGAAFAVQDVDGNTALHLATTRDFAAALLAVAPSLVDVANGAGRTAAHAFLARGSFEGFIECKRAGANLLTRDREGKTAMALAPLETLCALLMNASTADATSVLECCTLDDLTRPLALGGDGRSLLHAICAYDRKLLTPTPVAQRSFDFPVAEASSASSSLVSDSADGMDERRRMSSSDVLSGSSRHALAAGTSSQFRPRLGTAPASGLAAKGSSTSLSPPTAKPARDPVATKVNLIYALSALGFPIDARDTRGRTSLREATERGDVEICRALVAVGADSESLAEDGRSPKVIAAFNAAENPALPAVLSADEEDVMSCMSPSAIAPSRRPRVNDGHGPLPALVTHMMEEKRKGVRLALEEHRRALSEAGASSGEGAGSIEAGEQREFLGDVYTHVWPCGDSHTGTWRYGLMHGDGVHVYCEDDSDSLAASMSASITDTHAPATAAARDLSRGVSVASGRSEYNPFDEGSGLPPDSPVPVPRDSGARSNGVLQGAHKGGDDAPCLCDVTSSRRHQIVYRGRWVDGFRHGAGVVTWPDGRMEMREYNKGVVVAVRAMDERDASEFTLRSRLAAVEAALATSRSRHSAELATMRAEYERKLSSRDSEHAERVRVLEGEFTKRMESEMRMRADAETEMRLKIERVEEERETIKETFQLAIEVQKREVERTRTEFDTALAEAAEDKRVALEQLRAAMEEEKRVALAAADEEKAKLNERIAHLERSCDDFVRAQEMFVAESDDRERASVERVRLECEQLLIEERRLRSESEERFRHQAEADAQKHSAEINTIRELCERQIARVRDEYRGRVELQERERLAGELADATREVDELRAALAASEETLARERESGRVQVTALRAECDRELERVRAETEDVLARIQRGMEEDKERARRIVDDLKLAHDDDLRVLRACNESLSMELDAAKASTARAREERDDRQRTIASLRERLGRLEGSDIATLSVAELRALAEVIKGHKRSVNRALIIAEERERRPAAASGDDAAGMCVICYERPLDTILRPCNHAYCSVCANVLQKCPKCRSDVRSREHIFLN
eukprot:Opistho-1_new@60991